MQEVPRWSETESVGSIVFQEVSSISVSYEKIYLMRETELQTMNRFGQFGVVSSLLETIGHLTNWTRRSKEVS